MAKFASNDILRILRKFRIASEDNVPRNIEELKKIAPDEFSEIFSFKFLNNKYYIVVDGQAEDDDQYIVGLINVNFGGVSGELIKNPNDELTSFALPFQGKDVYLFKVVSNRRRLDVVLAEAYPDLSRSSIQKYIKLGYAQINDKIADQPKNNVSIDDTISLNIPSQQVDKLDFDILYEDENVIAINKPAGILTHSKGVINDEYTVADFFADRGSTFAVSTNRAGIVHRLDRGTSGVIIGAKNDKSAKKLQKQFSERTTKKTYLAIVIGHPDQPGAIIDLPIARNNAVPSTFKVDLKGKSATTKYEVIESTNNYSLVKLEPKTGRTHQLRVHMSYIGNPILGDVVYANEKDNQSRMFLHAQKLEISIPPNSKSQTAQRMIFESKTPESFNQIIENDR